MTHDLLLYGLLILALVTGYTLVRAHLRAVWMRKTLDLHLLLDEAIKVIREGRRDISSTMELRRHQVQAGLRKCLMEPLPPHQRVAIQRIHDHLQNRLRVLLAKALQRQAPLGP